MEFHAPKDFHTLGDVRAYAAQHGVDGLRMSVAIGTLQGGMRDLVEQYLRSHDADQAAREREEQAREALKIAERSAAASERSAAAAERSADATDRAARAAERSARYAMYASIISLLAIIVTLAGAYYGWNK